MAPATAPAPKAREQQAVAAGAEPELAAGHDRQQGPERAAAEHEGAAADDDREHLGRVAHVAHPGAHGAEHALGRQHRLHAAAGASARARRGRRGTRRRSTRKFAAGPAAATARPPRAGPAERAMLKPMLPRVTAAGSSSRGTSSGMIACQAGWFMAAPRPSRKVKRRRSQGVVRPASVSRPRPAAASSIQVWVTSSRRRRSTTSASAPAGRASRNIGRLVAACTSATMVGDGDSVVISQAAPTLWNQVPRLEATVAIHSQR